MLPFSFPIFKRPGVFIHCRSAAQFHIIRPVTSQYRIAIFQIWGGKWQCSLFSDKGVATTMCAADAAQVLLIPAAAGIKVQYDSLFLHNVFFLATLPQTQIGRHTQIGKVHLYNICRLSSQSTPEFEVETLYLTAGIIIFDTLVPRAFQKYTTRMVFKAVQPYEKSAI